MYKYILKRILVLIPVIVIVAFLIFFMMKLTPGDPALAIAPDASEEALEEIRDNLGINDPLMVQFGRYMFGLVRGDLGNSYFSNKSVFSEYAAKFPATLKLSVCAIAVAIVISIPLGIICAIKRNSFIDNIFSLAGLIGVAMPNFWMGLLLIIFFSLNLGWVPSGGSSGWKSIILPAVTLGTAQAALILRTTRSSMLEVIRQDYINTARAKGLKEKVVMKKHALKNALIPIITVIGIQLGNTLGGAVVIETVFSWPGVGRLIIDSLTRKDLPMVMGCIILTTIVICITNLLIDIQYAYVDPRIKAQYRR